MWKEPVKHEVAQASHLALSLVKSVLFLKVGYQVKVSSECHAPTTSTFFYPLDRGLGMPHVRSGFFGEETLFVRQDFRRCLSERFDSAWVRICDRPATGLAAALGHSGIIRIYTTWNVPWACWKVKLCFLAGITAGVGSSLSWLGHVMDDLVSIFGRSRTSRPIFWSTSYPVLAASHSPQYQLLECETDKTTVRDWREQLLPWQWGYILLAPS